MTNPEAILHFRIPPHPHLSRVVREGVTEFARPHGIPDEELALLLTALGEAIANAIEHAKAERPIEVEVRLEADRIVATVRDDGIGFEAGPGIEPTLPDPAAERGRGLPIMRRCSDIFAIDSVAGKGTSVVLGRYLRPPANAHLASERGTGRLTA